MLERRPLYERLVAEHSASLYRYALRSLRDAHAAEDAIQETYCEAWRFLDSLREPDHGKAWLFRILRRRIARGFARRDRQAATVDGGAPVEDVIGDERDDVGTRVSERELLRGAVDSLDRRFAEPFLMMAVDGLSCREIADLIEIPLGTVLSRIHRARKALRKHFEQHDPDRQPGPPADKARSETS